MFPRTFLLLLGAANLPACLIDQATYDDRLRELTRGETGGEDADGDGFGSVDDCDDSDADVHPDAPEVCDGVDQDCDGEIDEDATDAPTWYADADGDGYGAGGDASSACERPSTHVADATDCDDTDASVHPDAEDIPYDEIDQDCVGGDPEDLDGDGYVAVEARDGDDCDDTDASVHPDAEETWGNGFTDNDCDGELEEVTLDFGAEAWTGLSAGAHAGRRLAALGDLDGDGRDSILVGSPFESGAYSNGGAAYIVSGSPGESLAGGITLSSHQADLFLGGAMDGGVDVDDDGIGDFIVTGTGADSGTGVAWLITGAGLSGDNTAADVATTTLVGSSPATYFGSHAAFVGDVTGDGLEDLAVSAPAASAGGYESTGVVGIWTAAELEDGELADAPLQIEGVARASIGNYVSASGDVNGDGHGDLLVSSTDGVLAVVLPGGGSTWDFDQPLFKLLGEGFLGSGDVRMVGDISGDGNPDLACLTEDVLIFTALAGWPVRGIEEPSAVVRVGADSFLYDVVDLGDRDADGHAELLVPVQWYAPLSTSVLAVHSGATLGFGADVSLADPGLEARAVRPSAAYGYRAIVAGDLDGDGAEEIAVGGYGDDEAGPDAGGVTTLRMPR